MLTFTQSSLLLAIVFSTGVAHSWLPRRVAGWVEGGTLNIKRYGCKAHVVDDDHIIALAGFSDDGVADNTAEIYDAVSGTWSLTAPMPDGFAPGAIPWSARIEGDEFLGFLITGGFNAFFGGDLRSFIYDVTNDAWIEAGPVPETGTLASNFGHLNAVTLDDGRILCASGLQIGVGESHSAMLFTPNYANLDAAEPLAPEDAGTWSLTQPLKGASEHHRLVKLADGRALLIHGNDHAYFGTPWGALYRDTHGVQAELFDPATESWTALPNLPAIPGEDDRHTGVKGVRQMAGVGLLPDGRVLVYGGTSTPLDQRRRPLLAGVYYERASAVIFDPDAADAGRYPWTITGSMKVAREWPMTFPLRPQSDRLVAIGGWGYWSATSATEIYDPESGTWHFGPRLPELEPGSDEPLITPGGCPAQLPNGRIVIAGGFWDPAAEDVAKRTLVFNP